MTTIETKMKNETKRNQMKPKDVKDDHNRVYIDEHN